MPKLLYPVTVFLLLTVSAQAQTFDNQTSGSRIPAVEGDAISTGRSVAVTNEDSEQRIMGLRVPNGFRSDAPSDAGRPF